MHDTYTILRELADSWVLLAMTAFFLGACLWAFRPGSRTLHDDAAQAIFREDRAAGGAEGGAPARRVPGCENTCPDCTCASVLERLK